MAEVAQLAAEVVEAGVGPVVLRDVERLQLAAGALVHVGDGAQPVVAKVVVAHVQLAQGQLWGALRGDRSQVAVSQLHATRLDIQ